MPEKYINHIFVLKMVIWSLKWRIMVTKKNINHTTQWYVVISTHKVIRKIIKKFSFNYKGYNLNTKYGEKIDSKSEIKQKLFFER